MTMIFTLVSFNHLQFLLKKKKKEKEKGNGTSTLGACCMMLLPRLRGGVGANIQAWSVM